MTEPGRLKVDDSRGLTSSTSASDSGTAMGNEMLGPQIRSGLSWSFANIAIARIVTLASGVVLARILTPRDFGVFALALVATDLLMSFNDVGLIAAIVRYPGDVTRPARTAITLALMSSTLLYGLIFVAAGPFAAALHTPDATGVIRLLAVAVIIDGVSAVPTGLLTRTLRQDLRAFAELGGLLVTLAVSIVLAQRGLGPWGLAWGRLAGNGTATVLLMCLAPNRSWPGFHLGDAREFLNFGLPLAGAALLTFGLLNIHYIIVGYALGPADLGYYVLAFNISSWPVQLLSQTARRVSLVGFARLAAGIDALRNGFVRAFILLMAVTVPTCLLLSLLAEPLIRVVYGSRWSQSIDALRFLAVLAAARVAGHLVEDLLVATGRSRTVLCLQGIWLLALLPALAVGAHAGGIRGVGVAQAAVAVAVLPVFLITVHRAGIRIGDLVTRLPSLAYACGGTAIVSLFLFRFVPSDLGRLLYIGTAAAAIYTLILIASPGIRSILWPRRTVG